jgi:putative transposase
MRRRFSKEQIIGFLREAAAGTPVMDLCWNYCFSRSAFQTWKTKYGDSVHGEALRRARRTAPASAAAD